MSDSIRTEGYLAKNLKDRLKKLNKPDWWTITLPEFLDLYRGLQYRDFIGRLHFYTFDHTVAGQSKLRELTYRHRAYIKKCITEGKTVPDNVLKAYPDFTKLRNRLLHKPLPVRSDTLSQKESKKSTPETQGRGRPIGGSRFTDKDRDKMRVEIGNGVTAKELAKKFNVSVAAIRYQLKKPSTA